MDRTSITPDPAALRAMAHPLRLRMLGLLRIDGPATATTLATRLGLNTGATSYHLRQLAQHGFVVDDESRGTGRERWWKAAHTSTRTEGTSADPAESDAIDAFGQAVAVVHAQAAQRAVEERPLLPDAWRNASTMSDWVVRATPERARELLDALMAVLEGWDEDDADAEGVEPYQVVLQTFPYPGRVSGAEEPS